MDAFPVGESEVLALTAKTAGGSDRLRVDAFGQHRLSLDLKAFLCFQSDPIPGANPFLARRFRIEENGIGVGVVLAQLGKVGVVRGVAQGMIRQLIVDDEEIVSGSRAAVSRARLPIHEGLVVIGVPGDSQGSCYFSYFFAGGDKVFEVERKPRCKKD